MIKEYYNFIKDNDEIKLNLFDEETIAETLPVYLNDIDVKKIKFNKKYKLFI